MRNPGSFYDRKFILFSVFADNSLLVASLRGVRSGRGSVDVIIGAIVGGILFAVMLIAIILFVLQRRGDTLDLGCFGTIGSSKPQIPSSPHYLSAKQQNHYVSMGSLDWKKSSVVDNSAGGSISTLGRGHRPTPLKLTSSTGVSTDYPTATIKRNSGGHNQMRTNIQADDNF